MRRRRARIFWRFCLVLERSAERRWTLRDRCPATSQSSATRLCTSALPTYRSRTMRTTPGSHSFCSFVGALGLPVARCVVGGLLRKLPNWVMNACISLPSFSISVVFVASSTSILLKLCLQAAFSRWNSSAKAFCLTPMSLLLLARLATLPSSAPKRSPTVLWLEPRCY